MMPWRAWFVQAVAGLGAVLLLLAVFLMYTRPGFLVQMADQLWACF